jgi:uncharacterized protein YoxC
LEWIGWGFLVIAALVAVFLIRTLIQVSKTVRTAEGLLKSLEAEVTPLVRNLKVTSDHLNRLLQQAQERLNQIEALFQTLKESAQTVSTINRILRGGITSTLLNVAGLAVGVKTAGQTLFKSIGKGGSDHGRRK